MRYINTRLLLLLLLLLTAAYIYQQNHTIRIWAVYAVVDVLCLQMHFKLLV